MMPIEAFIEDVKPTVVMKYEVQYRDESKFFTKFWQLQKITVPMQGFKSAILRSSSRAHETH